MTRDYEHKMAGPYSDLNTRFVVVIQEHQCGDGSDAPCYIELEQEEFSDSQEQLTHETLQFC